jgi:hypothetical protein
VGSKPGEPASGPRAGRLQELGVFMLARRVALRVMSASMRFRRMGLLLFLGFSLSFIGSVCEAEEDKPDSAEGLPDNYAKNYLVARSTMSREKKFAVIYPTLDFSDSKDAKDFLVALEPFRVLGTLPTENFYFQNESHGGISASWSEDDSVALIVLERKWGPGDAIVVELAGGKVKRMTNVLQKLTQLLLPKFQAARRKKEAYNENYQFIYEPGDDYEPCTLGGSKTVELNLLATNDPKSISDHPWSVRVKAEWDIAAGKFGKVEVK